MECIAGKAQSSLRSSKTLSKLERPCLLFMHKKSGRTSMYDRLFD